MPETKYALHSKTDKSFMHRTMSDVKLLRLRGYTGLADGYDACCKQAL